MALEFICSNNIEYEKRIKIPESANCYRLNSGKIKFFRVNLNAKDINFIIENATEISFDIEKYAFHISYGNPVFYNVEGNILKVNND